MSDDTTPAAAGDEPAADPSNSEPGAWTAPLDDDEFTEMAGLVNDVAVNLPEPAATPAGGVL